MIKVKVLIGKEWEIEIWVGDICVNKFEFFRLVEIVCFFLLGVKNYFLFGEYIMILLEVGVF